MYQEKKRPNINNSDQSSSNISNCSSSLSRSVFIITISSSKKNGSDNTSCTSESQNS